jgi:hypothetical protein
MRRLLTAVVLAALALPAAAQGATAGAKGPGCDRLDDAACLLPFPNDAFTHPSASASTVRLDLRRSQMPRDRRGVRFPHAPFKSLDGFSPTSTIVTRVPGLTSAKRVGVRLFDSRSGRGVSTRVTLESGLLTIRPRRALQEGFRYVVAIRGGAPAGARFAALRDGRRKTPRYQVIFRALRRAHIARDRRLFLAWDFTVASERSLTGRLQTMRDRALAQLGGAPPDYTVAEGPADPRFARVLTGTVTVPCYLTTSACAAGGSFHVARSGDFLPAQSAGNVTRAPFTCVVPATATPSAPARMVLSGEDPRTKPALAAEHGMVLCHTPWLGTGETNPAARADGMQQGVLNALLLGRLMSHPQGLTSHPLLTGLAAAQPLYFHGSGAGPGAALVAFSPDVTRAVLTDPRLHASVPAPTSYRDRRERAIARGLAEILADRGEAGGLAAHLASDPPAATPAHRVLLQGTGSNAEAAVIARTLGQPITPLDDARASAFLRPGG